jgi:hypothetical protein
MAWSCFLFVLFLFVLSTVGSRCLQTLNHHPKIALTRSQEGNQALDKLLTARGIPSVQLPCIEFVEKDFIPDHHFSQCDIVVVTSPQVANLLSE